LNDNSLTSETSGPVERLALSRERLRQAMQQQKNAGGRRGTGASAAPGGMARAGRRWRRSLASIPGVSIVLEALESWWAQHPMRLASMVGSEAAKTLIQPMAKRHPLALVAGAMALGAAVVWVKPWRWGLKPALFTGLLSQFASKALAQVPVASWLAMLSELAPRPRPEAPVGASVGKTPHATTTERPAPAEATAG
jgi:hypothetical protein